MDIIENNNEGASQIIKDVNVDNFMQDVIEASNEKPIVVDFWAPWCEPCKQLTPLLEAAILENKDKLILAKIDIEKNQEIAAQLKIQSIPTVYAFFEGKVVDGFQGIQSKSEIQKFIQKLISLVGPGEDIEALQDLIKSGLEKREWNEVMEYAQNILTIDQENKIAFGALMRSMIGLNQFEDVREMNEALSPTIKESKPVIDAYSLLETSEKAFEATKNIQIFQTKLNENPNDLDVMLEMAVALYGKGSISESFDLLLRSIEKDSQWSEQAARKQLLEFFNTTGFEAEETILARRKLASLLFS
ncbi:tetratricopeptide repeat protein [Alphaproteobacteria bacterium]|nr:tetratricopeptide repeat protein [Alphaproteobacteria bacterium]